MFNEQNSNTLREEESTRNQNMKAMELTHCCYQVNSSTTTKKFVLDVVTIEEPLQLSLHYYDHISETYKQKVLLVMMRTPGEDKALITGFLFSEGIIKSIDDIENYRDDEKYDELLSHGSNAIVVTLKKEIDLDWEELQRHFINHSSCGICGKTLLNSLSLKKEMKGNIQSISSKAWLSIDEVLKLPDLISSKQKQYNKTGSAHGVGYVVDSEILYLSEDVGRHNAVDKVIGNMLLSNTTNNNAILLLSGRVSLELIQKALMANISVIVAIGAPSSLAVKVAKQFDLTLIGFVKKNRCNVYHGNWRIKK